MRVLKFLFIVMIFGAGVFQAYERFVTDRKTSAENGEASSGEVSDDFLRVPWLNDAPRNTVLVIGPT